MVCQDRWSLVTSSIILKCRTFCQKYLVLRGSGLSRRTSLYNLYRFIANGLESLKILKSEDLSPQSDQCDWLRI